MIRSCSICRCSAHGTTLPPGGDVHDRNHSSRSGRRRTIKESWFFLYCPEKVSRAARRHCHVVYSVRDAQAHQLRLTMSGPIGAADAVFSSPLHVTAAAWSTANVVKTSHRYFPQGHVGSSVPHRNIIKSSQLRQNELRRKMAVPPATAELLSCEWVLVQVQPMTAALKSMESRHEERITSPDK
jgi:hypothetical protein